MKGAPQINMNHKTPAAPAVAAVARRATGTDGKVTITIAGQAIPVRQITIPAGEVAEKTTVFTGNERIQDLLTETSLSDLLPDIRDHGQQHAGTGRRLNSGDIEVADGSRRRMAAIITDQPYTILVGDFSNAQMEQISESGNVYRPPSAYEKGMKLTRELNELHDGKLERLAKAKEKHKEGLRKYINTATLPDDIIKAYPSPNDLIVSKGNELAKLWQQPELKSKMIQALSELKLAAKNDERPLTANEITNCLLAIGNPKVEEPEIELKGGHGTLKRTKGNGADFKLKGVSEDKLKTIKGLIEDVMNEK